MYHFVRIFVRSSSSREMCTSIPTKSPKEVGEVCEDKFECRTNKYKKVCVKKKKKKMIKNVIRIQSALVISVT